jgi:hypothetical protein
LLIVKTAPSSKTVPGAPGVVGAGLASIDPGEPDEELGALSPRSGTEGPVGVAASSPDEMLQAARARSENEAKTR